MQKSKIFTVLDNTGQNRTVCWLGDDKFSEDIKDFDGTNADDIDLIGKNWDGEDDKDTVIQEITHVHEIN